MTVEEMETALRKGHIVNAFDDDGLPAPIRDDENYSGAFLSAPIATAVVSAEDLAAVIDRFAIQAEDRRANSQGLRLRQVVVRGSLNLNWIRCPFPLGFEGCDFYGSLSAEFAEVPWLAFDSCDFTPHDHVISRHAGALNAQSLTIEQDLQFWDCQGLKQLFIPNARIGSFNPRAEAFSDSPDGTSAANRDETGRPFRTVIDGAEFGTLYVPQADPHNPPFKLTGSVRVNRLVVAGDEAEKPAHETAKHVYGWLTSTKEEQCDRAAVPAQGVVDELAAALRRSGQGDAATELGVLAATSGPSRRACAAWPSGSC